MVLAKQALPNAVRRNRPHGRRQEPTRRPGHDYPGIGSIKEWEISLFEVDQEEAEAAKTRLDGQREKRRERHAKNKEKINAKRRVAYVPKKSTNY